MNFIEFLTGLAVEGETALFVQQKKQRGGNYVWPAFLPQRAIFKPGQSWFCNTGSFVVDRFKGPPSAARANCDYVLVMMLDDIGTKSTTPPLEPTWVMETSPGNFQWGYVFSEQPSKAAFSAAIRAIADAGYTDPGAINPVRNFRLPGSINIKNGFEAVLREFHPERDYTLENVCEALGVEPAEPDTAEHRPIQLADTGADSVLAWLSETGLVLSEMRPNGWLDIVCPNHAEHTDGEISAGYAPTERVFKCLHGHCEQFTSEMFLAWVRENGGPAVQSGVRDDLMAEMMARALDKLEPTQEFRDAAAEVVASVERRQVGRVDKSQWYTRFAYVMSDDSYFDMSDRRELSRANFNAIFRHVRCESIHNNRRIEAAVCYDENRKAHDSHVLTGVTYAPGEGVLVEKDGEAFGNRWIDARPKVSVTGKPKIDPWMDHCKHLIPDPHDLNHVLDVMAFKLQNPNRKINHAILHGSDEGVGKDTLWAPFIWSVSGPDFRNRSIVEPDGLHSQWGYDLEAEIMILNELKEPRAAERRALANRLKPIIAAPPHTITINRKGLHPYSMVNRVFVLGFSNYLLPISLPSTDRRWLCLWSEAHRMTKEDANTLWAWYEGGGYEAVASWLWRRDVSKFNPAAAPHMTDWKRTMIEQSLSVAESSLVELIQAGRGVFAKGAVRAPFNYLLDDVQDLLPAGTKVYPSALLQALKEAGWQDVGRVSSVDYPNKRHIYASPYMIQSRTKSELRRIVEEPVSAPLLRAVGT